MTAQHLFARAAQLGLRLEARGGQLAVIPGNHCPPQLAKELRQHKNELLAMLHARNCTLGAQHSPWLHIARQVIAGEFEGADLSTVESLTIGLRSISHPDCVAALNGLQDNKEKKTRR